MCLPGGEMDVSVVEMLVDVLAACLRHLLLRHQAEVACDVSRRQAALSSPRMSSAVFVDHRLCRCHTMNQSKYVPLALTLLSSAMHLQP